MLRGRFDEKCPHCEHALKMRSIFESRDYNMDFEFDCPACQRRVECIVHTVPEFELSPAKKGP